MTDSEAYELLVESGWATTAELLEVARECGLRVTAAGIESSMGRLKAAGRVALTPRGNWRLVKERKGKGSGAPLGEVGKLTRCFIYSPGLLAACPRFTRNTVLHFVSNGRRGFRLRDYVDGERITVDQVGVIKKTLYLEREFEWTEFEFDDAEERTALTENAFWQERIERMNATHADLLKKGAKAAGK